MALLWVWWSWQKTSGTSIICNTSVVTRMEISPQKGIAVSIKERAWTYFIYILPYKVEIQPFQRKKAPLKICLRVFDICISGKKRGGSKVLGNWKAVTLILNNDTFSQINRFCQNKQVIERAWATIRSQKRSQFPWRMYV